VDNLTHALVGAALARSGFDRATPLATATLVLAANAPDVDVLAYTQGEWFALANRRGITHGVPALLVLPFAVSATMAGWDRFVRRRLSPDAPPAPFRALLLLSFVGVLTHPVLDWMNTYGMRWWLPFDGSWSYGDALFIIDPWIWLMLGGAAVLGAARTPREAAAWAVLGALTSAPVLLTPLVPPAAKAVWLLGLGAIALARWRGPSAAPRRLALARALTGAAAVYVLALLAASRLAEADVRSALGEAGLDDADVDDVMIQPLPANPLVSEVVIETPDRYVRGSHRWGRSPRVALGELPALPRRAPDDPEALRAIQEARLHPDLRHYLTWSRFPYWQVERDGEGARVRVGDARYVARTGGLSGLAVRVPGDDRGPTEPSLAP
jgi:inner membrane protein